MFSLVFLSSDFTLNYKDFPQVENKTSPIFQALAFLKKNPLEFWIKLMLGRWFQKVLELLELISRPQKF